MSGRHALATLTTEFTPERRARVDAGTGELRATIPLHELRQARAMTRKAVGEVLKVNQPAVAEPERRTDMYVSNLRAYIEAMGGRLNIVAEFPRGSVVITNFSDPGEEAKTCLTAVDRQLRPRRVLRQLHRSACPNVRVRVNGKRIDRR